MSVDFYFEKMLTGGVILADFTQLCEEIDSLKVIPVQSDTRDICTRRLWQASVQFSVLKTSLKKVVFSDIQCIIQCLGHLASAHCIIKEVQPLYSVCKTI